MVHRIIEPSSKPTPRPGALPLAAWLREAGDLPAGAIRGAPSLPSPRLAAEGAGFQAWTLRADSPARLWAQIPGLARRFGHASGSLRALAVRLERALGALPANGAPAPRLRRSITLLASRLLLETVRQVPALIIFDLRGAFLPSHGHRSGGDATDLLRGLAGGWLEGGLRFRESEAQGRVLFLVDPEVVLPAGLPELAAEPDTDAPPILRFVASNIEAVARVAHEVLDPKTRHVWAVLGRLGHPLQREELSALVDEPEGATACALQALSAMGVLLSTGEGIAVSAEIPAPPLDDSSVEALASALAARLRFARDPSAACDLLRIAPDRLRRLTSLRALIPEVMRALRSDWRHREALALGALVSAEPPVAVELCRTWLDLGERDAAAAALTPLVGGDSTCRDHVAAVGTTLRSALSDVAAEAIHGQVDPVARILLELEVKLPEALRRALEAHCAYAAGDAERALDLVTDAEGPLCALIRSRALIALLRHDEVRQELVQLRDEACLALGGARVRGNLALLLLAQGRYRQAVSELRAVYAIFEESALEVESALALGNLGIALEFLGEYGEAESCLRESLDRLSALPTFHGELRTRLALVDLLVTLGRTEEARRLLASTEGSVRAQDLSDLHADALLRQVRLYLREGHLSAAAGHLRRAESTISETHSEERHATLRIMRAWQTLLGGEAAPLGPCPARVRLETRRTWALTTAWSDILSDTGDPLGALTRLIPCLEESGDKHLLWEALALRAAAYAVRGEADRSAQDLAAARAILESLARGLDEAAAARFLGQPWHRALCGLAASLAPRIEAPEPPPSLPSPTRDTGKMVGTHPGLLHALSMAERYAGSSTPVLVLGESGTGKELMAELIHRWSPRAGRPLVRVNAAAISDTLLLSELFGHERGAFTGADRRRAGKFEVANGGTLFLDEIGDISPSAQAALLRVLQDGTFHRVGGTQLVRTDVRVVAATNRDLDELVREGRFRLDLFYRISSLSLTLPPLRDRLSDLEALCRSILDELSEPGRVQLEPGAIQLLAAHTWPGNVRELKNALERLRHMADGPVITAAHVREYGPSQALCAPSPGAQGPAVELGPGFSLRRAQRKLEIELIQKALADSDGNIAAAARLLGITRPALSRRVKEYGLK